MDTLDAVWPWCRQDVSGHCAPGVGRVSLPRSRYQARPPLTPSQTTGLPQQTHPRPTHLAVNAASAVHPASSAGLHPLGPVVQSSPVRPEGLEPLRSRGVPSGSALAGPQSSLSYPESARVAIKFMCHHCDSASEKSLQRGRTGDGWDQGGWPGGSDSDESRHRNSRRVPCIVGRGGGATVPFRPVAYAARPQSCSSGEEPGGRSQFNGGGTVSRSENLTKVGLAF